MTSAPEWPSLSILLHLPVLQQFRSGHPQDLFQWRYRVDFARWWHALWSAVKPKVVLLPQIELYWSLCGLSILAVQTVKKRQIKQQLNKIIGWNVSTVICILEKSTLPIITFTVITYYQIWLSKLNIKTTVKQLAWLSSIHLLNILQKQELKPDL